MARINLLPWREERRKHKQKEFLLLLGFAVIVTGGAMAGVHSFIAGSIEFQTERNAYLDKEIKKLDQQIKEINQLEAMKKSLIARIEIIQQLQASRPRFVHFADELVRTLPDGVFLTKVVQKGNQITLDGVAQSNARVSNYMWNIDKSKWLSDPNLDVIHTNDKGGERTSQFVLRAAQVVGDKDHPTANQNNVTVKNNKAKTGGKKK